MDVITKARELGKLIQEDERYVAYHAAKVKNDEDENLQKLIGEFNLKRVNLNSEMSKADKSQEKIDGLNKEIQDLYQQIMTNKNMADFTNAKNAMDVMLNQVNMVITMSANGENPETCPVESPNCSGSCSTCGGCS